MGRVEPEMEWGTMTEPALPATLADLTEEARDLLQGAIDLHVHCAPDPFADRKMDARELVRDSIAAGLGGIVLKSHEYPTQPLTWAVSQEMPGIDVYGAIALDHGVGGLNVDALEIALRIGTKVVWLPTFDALWSRERYGRWHSRKDAITLLDEAGALLPVCHELLDLIAEHGGMLCTGHVSPEETRVVVRAARERGIGTVVTHATWFGIPLEVQREAAELGAVIEAVGNPTFKAEDGAEALAAALRDVRALGPQHVALSTDLGQAANPIPSVGFGIWIQHFLDAGFSTQEVRQMVQANPARVLG